MQSKHLKARNPPAPGKNQKSPQSEKVISKVKLGGEEEGKGRESHIA